MGNFGFLVFWVCLATSLDCVTTTKVNALMASIFLQVFCCWFATSTLFEIGNHYAAQAGLQLLGSNNLPDSASRAYTIKFCLVFIEKWCHTLCVICVNTCSCICMCCNAHTWMHVEANSKCLLSKLDLTDSARFVVSQIPRTLLSLLPTVTCNFPFSLRHLSGAWKQSSPSLILMKRLYHPFRFTNDTIGLQCPFNL